MLPPGHGGPVDSCVAVDMGRLYAGSIGLPKRWTRTGGVSLGTPLLGRMNVMHVRGGRLYIGGIVDSTSFCVRAVIL